MQPSVTMAVRMALALVACVSYVPLAPALGGEAQPLLKLDLRIAQTGAGQPPAGPAPGAMALSLKDSIALALKNNLDITIEGFNPQIRDQDLTFEKSVFDPSAFLEATRTDNRLPSSLNLLTGQRVLSDFWDFNTGLRQKLPTGGTYELRFNNEYLHVPSGTTSATTTRNGFIGSFGLTLTQPLLKNFGFEANETNIRIATNNQSISREQLRLKVSNITTQVQNAYVELVFAIENLGVQQRSLQLARDLVALNKARVRAGVAAPVEVTQAEAQEAAHVQNVILGEKAVRDAEDTLKVILNLSRGIGAGVRRFSRPIASRSSQSPSTWTKPSRTPWRTGTSTRAPKLDIENKELAVRLTRNQLLPDLSLVGGVSTNGFGTNYGNDMSTMGGGDFVSYSVGVVLTVPSGEPGRRDPPTRRRG